MMYFMPIFLPSFLVFLQMQGNMVVALSSLRGSEYPIDDGFRLGTDDGILEEMMPFSSKEGKDTPVVVECGDKNVTLPGTGIVLSKGSKSIMWCPNPKIATTTFTSAIAYILNGEKIPKRIREGEPGDAHVTGMRGGFLPNNAVSSLVGTGREKELCNLDWTFTFVRNPWDRVRSAYNDKVNRVVFVPGHHNASFSDFVHALKKTDPQEMNAHWKPVSTHCFTAGPEAVHYNKMYKIEGNFEGAMADVFSHLGIAKEHTLAKLHQIGARNHKDSTENGLKARRETYKSKALEKMVAEIYADDIKVSGYSFGKLG